MSKLLSIIIPSYNMEHYLRKCLDSLCVDDAALFDLLDVIVVNDGSTDSTSAIAHEFAERHPSVFRVIDKPNGHYGSCINRGLKEAVGEFVKVLDADDTFDKQAFTLFLTELNMLSQSKQPIDLILSDSAFVNEFGDTLEDFTYHIPTATDLTLDDITGMNTLPAMPAFTYRRAIFKNLNYHQTEGIAYTDTEWLFLPMIQVGRIRYLPIAVYRYLKGRTEQSTSQTASIRQVGMLRQTFEVKIKEFILRHTTWTSASLRYANRALATEAGGLYCLYLQCGSWRCKKELSTLDTLTRKELAHLRGEIGKGIYLTIGKSLQFQYVRFCVAHPFARPLFSVALMLKRFISSLNIH